MTSSEVKPGANLMEAVDAVMETLGEFDLLNLEAVAVLEGAKQVIFASSITVEPKGKHGNNGN